MERNLSNSMGISYYKKNQLIALLITIFLPLHTYSQNTSLNLHTSNFKNPPSNANLHIWWHWMDGNISKEGITKDLEAMKEQGIVQATILNVGLFHGKSFGVPLVKFETPEWYAMFRWALQEANRLDITIGAHNCDGWSTSGGPWITPQMSMKQFVFTKTIVKGEKKLDIHLKQPFAIQNFYKDVAVVAYKTKDSLNSSQSAKPIIRMNDSLDAAQLMDGDPVSGVKLNTGDYLQLAASSPLVFDKIAIYPRKPFTWYNTDEYMSVYTISVSNDGKTFRKLIHEKIKGLNKISFIQVPKTTAQYIRISLDELADNWLPFTITELELLKENEQPTYSPGVPHISEKTVSVKSAQEKYFYEPDTSSGDMLQSNDVIILSDKMTTDGKLHWEIPEGNWTIIRFGYTSTGSTNAPATNEGTGLECDKMDTAATNVHFNSFSKKLIDSAGKFAGNTFKFLLIDSWEAGFQNWTAGFDVSFEKRRGYSLLPYLPLLCGESMNSPMGSEAVLFDFRKTIAELIEQNYYGRFAQLCHQNKMQFHAEVIYGNDAYPPIDVLKANNLADLVMGEFWAGGYSRAIEPYKPSGPQVHLASSAAIGYNKKLYAAESYTGMAHYSESPAYLKPFGDQAFCAGVNQMILHSYVHQPTDKKPGMTLGEFGSHFNSNNLYWPYMKPWLEYQTRIQYILQQGTATPDVLYYLGDQLPQFYTPNQNNTLPFGYLLTACNFDMLQNRIKVQNGKMILNDKGNYSLLCLPEYPYMNYKTLQRLDTLVQQGANVLGPKPLYSFSLEDVINKTQFN